MLLKRNGSLFVFGGVCYGIIEIMWRGKTHWSMLITGGACFTVLYGLFGRLEKFSLAVKCVLGSAVITSFEFVSGCIFNKLLKLKVWDYSDRPFNIKGQICPLYSFLWALLCAPVSSVCKAIKKTSCLPRRAA